MKYLSLILVSILLLSFSACALGKIKSEALEFVVSAPEKSGAAVKNSLTKAFKSLCREAAIVADGHINGTVKPEATKKQLYDITERMVAEYENLDEGDAEKLGWGAVSCVMMLHDYVYKDSVEDKTMFKEWRDILYKLSE